MTTGRTNFDLQLTNCTVGADGAKTVAAYFQTGATVDNTSGRLKQTDTAGAKNVSLQLRDGTNTNVIFVGSSTQQNTNNFVDISSATSVTMPYSVEYYAEDTASAGAVASSVVYNLQYK
jgi:major type 1 subunit fimbrin (pilin)